MSDETTTSAVDPTAAALIEQVWGTTSGPAVAEEPAEAPADGEAAPAAVEAEKPVEEPAKDPAAERVATRILAAKRAEMRAAEQRRELATAKAEVDAQRAEIAEQLKMAEALKAAKSSPSKALEMLGMTPKEFLESLATEHEPAAVAARAMEGTASEVQKLQARIDAMEAAEQARIKAQKDEAERKDYDEATLGFLDLVGKNHTKYEALVEEYTDAEIARNAQAALDEVLGRDAHGRPVTRLQAYLAEHDGQPPSDEELAEFLNDRAAARKAARAAYHQRIGRSGVPAGLASSNGLTATTPTDQGPGPRTLTSRDASIKASPPKPWSQDAADEESLRILQAAMRSG